MHQLRRDLMAVRPGCLLRSDLSYVWPQNRPPDGDVQPKDVRIDPPELGCGLDPGYRLLIDQVPSSVKAVRGGEDQDLLPGLNLGAVVHLVVDGDGHLRGHPLDCEAGSAT